MRIFYRGATVSFNHTFYDSSGDPTAPSSANLHLAYPSTARHPNSIPDHYASTTVALTFDSTTQSWNGDWASRVASPGTVFYHIEADDLTLAVEDGQFQLRGNPANMFIRAST